MEEVPSRTSLIPLVSRCFLLCLIGVGTEGGIISIVHWNLRPVIFLGFVWEKSTKISFSSLETVWWGGGLQHQGVVLQKAHSLHRTTWKTNIFAGISPGVSPGYPRPLGVLKKVCAKGSLCSFC